MYYPLKPGQTSEKTARDFLRRHSKLIIHFCSFHQLPLYSIHTLVWGFLDFVDSNPVAAYEIIYDFMVPNHVKLAWVYDYIFKTPRLMYTAGRRGGGKNHLNYSLMDAAVDRGLDANIIGMPQAVAPGINVIPDLLDAKPMSFNVLDEVGITHSARDRDNDVTEDTLVLAVARHHDKWVNVMSQVTSMGDVNFMKLCDVFLMKEVSMFGLAYERDSIADQVPSYFVPKQKKTTFVMTDDFRCTVEFPTSDLWSDAYSKPFAPLDKALKAPTILELYDAGVRISMIHKFLVARSVRCTKDDVLDELVKAERIEDKKTKKAR